MNEDEEEDDLNRRNILSMITLFLFIYLWERRKGGHIITQHPLEPDASLVDAFAALPPLTFRTSRTNSWKAS